MFLNAVKLDLWGKKNSLKWNSNLSSDGFLFSNLGLHSQYYVTQP